MLRIIFANRPACVSAHVSACLSTGERGGSNRVNGFPIGFAGVAHSEGGVGAHLHLLCVGNGDDKAELVQQAPSGEPRP